MARKKDAVEIVNIAHPHTIKKFELIEAYVEVWAQKLLHSCNGVVFIDCMSNSGVYQDDDGNEVFGTPIRIARYLSKIMQSPAYQSKHAWCFFNDLSAEKIAILESHLPMETHNFHIITSTDDGNEFIKKIDIPKNLAVHYLLVYDPYQATVDWKALAPFLCNWGDVIINHMVSDSIRGVSQVKRASAKAKYEQTYLASIQELATFGNDREAYEKRVQEIMTVLRDGHNKRYYIASFPFFNTRNTIVYNLILGSSNIEGFKLFKKTAWQTFGGKSSAKDTRGTENQLMLNFDGGAELTTVIDEYYVKDISTYLYSLFKGKKDVPLKDVWGVLDEHPMFPSEGFANEIKDELKSEYHCVVSRSTITFPDRRS